MALWNNIVQLLWKLQVFTKTGSLVWSLLPLALSPLQYSALKQTESSSAVLNILQIGRGLESSLYPFIKYGRKHIKSGGQIIRAGGSLSGLGKFRGKLIKSLGKFIKSGGSLSSLEEV